MRLVYVRTQRGVAAEKWPEDMPVNNQTPEALVTIKVPDAIAHMEIDELVHQYPYDQHGG